MGDNLKQKMLGALAWSSIDRMGQQVIQLIISLVLARLLIPEDFGLVGVLAVFCSLSYVLVDSGFGQALIRDQKATQTDYSTVFFFNICASSALYAALFFVAPVIAGFFGQPLLTPIARVIFLGFIFTSVYLVPLSVMTKAFAFRTIAFVNVFSIFISGGSGILLALYGYGVWALVIQQIGYHFCRMVLFWIIGSWRPTAEFSFQSIKNIWGFSIHLMGVNVLNVIYANIYVLILGKFYPMRQVGYFTQANKLSETANFSIQAVLNNGIFPVLSNIQSNTERFRRVLGELTKAIALIGLPLMLFLIAIAEPLILVLLTDKWEPSIPYFRLLCLASLFASLYVLNVNALNCRGESKKTFKLELFKKLLITLSILLFPFGIKMMLVGYIIACTIAFFASLILIKKDLNVSYWQQVRYFIPALLTGMLLSVAVYLISFLFGNDVFRLLITQLAVGTIMYFICIRLFFRNYYEKAVHFIRNRFKDEE